MLKDPIFWIQHHDDEHIEFFIDEKSIGSVNHDENGWYGMRVQETMFRSIAKVIGAKVKEI